MQYVSTLFLWLLVFAIGTPAAAEPDGLAAGLALVKTGDYAGAAKVLRGAVENAPEDLQVNFLFALALNRSSGGKEAESALKKSLMQAPTDPAVNLELGLHYYRKNVDAEAGDYFENTILLAPKSSYAVQAEDMLTRIEERGKLKRWELNLTAGMQYDSNVILNGGKSPLPEGYTGKSDWSGILTAKGAYSLVREERMEVAASYSLYQNLHTSLTSFDLTHNLAELSGIYACLPNLRLKGTYGFEYVFLGGERYEYAHGFAPSLIFLQETWGSTTLDYRYRDTSYLDSAKLTDNSARSGGNHFAGISHTLPVGKGGALRASYSFDLDKTAREFWNYAGNQLLVGGEALLPLGFTGSLSGDIYWKRYQAVDPSYGTRRDDTQYTASLSLSKNFSPRYSLTLGELIVRNVSNIAQFDYTRFITSVFFNVRL